MLPRFITLLIIHLPFQLKVKISTAIKNLLGKLHNSKSTNFYFSMDPSIFSYRVGNLWVCNCHTCCNSTFSFQNTFMQGVGRSRRAHQAHIDLFWADTPSSVSFIYTLNPLYPSIAQHDTIIATSQ